jgi:hypothetical protein
MKPYGSPVCHLRLGCWGAGELEALLASVAPRPLCFGSWQPGEVEALLSHLASTTYTILLYLLRPYVAAQQSGSLNPVAASSQQQVVAPAPCACGRRGCLRLSLCGSSLRPPGLPRSPPSAAAAQPLWSGSACTDDDLDAEQVS